MTGIPLPVLYFLTPVRIVPFLHLTPYGLKACNPNLVFKNHPSVRPESGGSPYRPVCAHSKKNTDM